MTTNRLLLKLLVVAGASFLIAGLLLVGNVRARYEARLRAQLWPATAPAVSVLSNSAPASSPVLLLLGDSRLAEWGMPDLPGWRVVNAGTGGLTTGQIRLCAPELLDRFHPAVVVWEAGINDLKYLGLKPGLTATVVGLAETNTAAVVEACLRRGCKVLVLETWPASKPSPARRLVWSGQVAAGVQTFNSKLHALESLDKNVRVIDLFEKAGIKPGPGQYRDTLHFRSEVYRQLTPALAEEIGALAAAH